MLSVAVVGAGPAGLYAADALLRARDAGELDPPLVVTVIDRLPTPFGLLRYGVAPDHVKIKKIAATLEKVLADPDVAFAGDVELGETVDLDDLRRGHDAVVVACGAAVDRRLGLPGEDLPGSVSATAFVAWYSGHPDAALPPGLLDAEAAVVIGVGNVAVDVARVLLLGPDALAATDVPEEVLDALAASRVRTVTVVGRRGAVAATWTLKELRELGALPGVAVSVLPEDVVVEALLAGEAPAAPSPVAKRCLTVLQGWAADPPPGVGPDGPLPPGAADRLLRLRFHRRPEELLAGSDGRVAAVRCTRTDGSGRTEDLPAGLVLRAIGYRGVPLPGLPFDAARGVVPSVAGRVVDPPGDSDAAPVVRPGLYVSGWLRRGPTGVVGTNRSDATEVVAGLLTDARAGRLPAPTGPGLVDLLHDRGGRPPVDLEGWRRVDATEAEQGRGRGAARVKVADWEGLRGAAAPT